LLKSRWAKLNQSAPKVMASMRKVRFITSFQHFWRYRPLCIYIYICVCIIYIYTLNYISIIQSLSTTLSVETHHLMHPDAWPWSSYVILESKWVLLKITPSSCW
jgi:hypothetical protein